MPGVAENLTVIQQEIEQAAKKVNRDYRDIKLVAVSKTVSVDLINEAVAAGINAFGENRVQEITQKIPQLPSHLEWHFIGHLQTNKVKSIIDKVCLIHSLDRISLAEEISKRGAQCGRVIDVLVEVNIGGEETKHGLAPSETRQFIEDAADYPNLRIMGLMTVAPYAANPEEVRPVFRRLRLLAEEIGNSHIPGVCMKYLSMGMSNDFTVAIEEGANIIRVGSKIFGERNYK